MPGENALILLIHELLQYLNRQGATTFLTVAQHGLLGEMQSPVDLTYICRYRVAAAIFRSSRAVRRAVSVIKKRAGYHEDTIREYQIGSRGVTLGEPLTGFQGILRGVPRIVGKANC